MRHHTLTQFLFCFIFAALVSNGVCQFSSFLEVELDDDDTYFDVIDRSDDYIEDDDLKFEDQEQLENVVDASYKYQFNVVDEEEQVYQHQKQERDKGVGLSL